MESKTNENEPTGYEDDLRISIIYHTLDHVDSKKQEQNDDFRDDVFKGIIRNRSRDYEDSKCSVRLKFQMDTMYWMKIKGNKDSKLNPIFDFGGGFRIKPAFEIDGVYIYNFHGFFLCKFRDTYIHFHAHGLTELQIEIMGINYSEEDKKEIDNFYMTDIIWMIQNDDVFLRNPDLYTKIKPENMKGHLEQEIKETILRKKLIRLKAKHELSGKYKLSKCSQSLTWEKNI